MPTLLTNRLPLEKAVEEDFEVLVKLILVRWLVDTWEVHLIISQHVKEQSIS